MSNDESTPEKPKAMTRLVNKLTKEMLWMYILRLLQEQNVTSVLVSVIR